MGQIIGFGVRTEKGERGEEVAGKGDKVLIVVVEVMVRRGEGTKRTR